MPCSSQFISEMLPENHTEEMFDFFKLIIQSQLIYLSVNNVVFILLKSFNILIHNIHLSTIYT